MAGPPEENTTLEQVVPLSAADAASVEAGKVECVFVGYARNYGPVNGDYCQFVVRFLDGRGVEVGVPIDSKNLFPVEYWAEFQQRVLVPKGTRAI